MFSRRILFTSTALSTSLWWASAALAAGPAAYDWTGAYAGAGLTVLSGGHPGTLNLFLPQSLTNFPIDLTFNGPIPPLKGVGVTGLAEYDLQFDQFVLGIEGSLTAGSFAGVATFNTATTVIVGSDTTTLYGSTSIGEDTFFSTSWSEYAHTILGPTVTVGVNTFTSTTSWTDTTTLEGSTTIIGTDGTTTVVPNETSHSVLVPTSTSTEFDQTSSGETSNPVYGSAQVNVVGRASIDWLSEIKGKAGFVQDRTLFYVVGGLAIGQVTQSVSGTYSSDAPPGTNGTFTGSQSQMRVGGVIGAGIQQALDDHWFVQGEADYFNLGTAQYTGVNPSVTMTQVIDGFKVTGGILYKFN
jgi:opacity protein-like surface antigen